MKLKFFIFILFIATTLTATGESDSKENLLEQQKDTNRKVFKIMTSGEYENIRSKSIYMIIKSGSTFTSEDVKSSLHEWLSSAERREGDVSLIHFTPDMLNEINKDKFNKSIQSINREEVIDKLEALELIINNASDIDSSIFNRLINSKFNLFQKSDMAIHWSNYFLSNKNININIYTRKSLMRSAIQENNFSIAELLIKSSYKVTEKDFESLRGYTNHVIEENEGTIDKERALEALSKIENIMIEINSLKP